MALTEEDKAWLGSVLDSRFERFEAQIDSRFGRIEARLDKIEAKMADFAIDLKELEHRTNESLERVETRLLTEFHKWASPIDARMRSHAAAIKALDLEVESLADRVKSVEQRPPAQ